MSFGKFLFKEKQNNYCALGLFIAFFLFYVVINYPYILYMERHSSELIIHSPFYGVPFTLNLFNFDPSIYYGFGNASIIHPFLNFLAGSLTYLSEYLSGHLFFLIIHSVINAGSVVMIYYYLQKTETGHIISLLFASFFGISSYTIFTALIPDSYPYAQFVILLSVVYLLYCRMEDRSPLIPTALLAITNFGITSTNIVPFAGALWINMFQKRGYKFITTLLLIAVYFLIGVAALTCLQTLIGSSWIQNWLQSLHNGGFQYTAPFSFSQHWKAIYMLVISPVLTPDIVLIDPGIVAFATDLLSPYPLYVTVIGAAVLLMAALGFVRNRRTREPWVLAPFLLFAFGLHIVIGYGLAVFKYDLFLYAGHYLFVFFLLSARFIATLKHTLTRKILIGIILVFVLTTATHNIIKHGAALNEIKESYRLLM